MEKSAPVLHCIVPAIKPASEHTKTNTIAMLATPETAEGKYVDDLISEFASECIVLKIGCRNLARLSEQKAAGEHVSTDELLKELEPLILHEMYSEVDSLILGCTHFSLLLDEINEVINNSIKIFDPADAVARQVDRVHSFPPSVGVSSLVFTDLPKNTSGLNLCVNRLFYL